MTNLSILRFIIISKVKTGDYSANKQVESFYKDVLNMVYGWNLKRSDKITNVGIDLSCDTNKVGVQVTSQRGREKVEKTLSLFDEHYFKTLKRVMIFNITSKSNHSKDFTSKVPFDKTKDIIDVDDLLGEIEKFKSPKMKEIESYIIREIPYYIGRITSEGDILRNRVDFSNVEPKNCARFLEIQTDDDEFEKFKSKAKKLHENLLNVSQRQRLDLFSFFTKCDKEHLELAVSTWCDILMDSFGFKNSEFLGLLLLLNEKGFLYNDEYETLQKIQITDKDFWSDILTLITAPAELHDFICNINFSKLDN